MCCLGFEYSESMPADTVLSETETFSIVDEPERESELVVASSDSEMETAPEVRSDAGPRQPAAQPEQKRSRRKRRKWHPRKRRRKPPVK
jgi:hypothetical protein